MIGVVIVIWTSTFATSVDWTLAFMTTGLCLGKIPLPDVHTCHLVHVTYVHSLSTPTSSAPPPSTPPSAVASLVVFSFPDAHLVYQDHLTIQSIPQPYIPGFLAFREVPHYQSLLERALATQFYPSVVLVDGCGLLHPRQCGSACHLGVHAGIRAVGVAKNVLAVDGGCQHNKEVEWR